MQTYRIAAPAGYEPFVRVAMARLRRAMSAAGLIEDLTSRLIIVPIDGPELSSAAEVVIAHLRADDTVFALHLVAESLPTSLDPSRVFYDESALARAAAEL